MDTIEGDDRVGCSLAGEGYALDDVVAVGIGLGLQLQGTGRQRGGLDIADHAAVVLAIVGAVARIVEELGAQALVEGPIGLQLLLVADEQVVVVLHEVGFGEAFRPQTEFISRTLEVAELKLPGTEQRGLIIGHLQSGFLFDGILFCREDCHHVAVQGGAATGQSYVVVGVSLQLDVLERMGGSTVAEGQSAVGCHAQAEATPEVGYRGIAEGFGIEPHLYGEVAVSKILGSVLFRGVLPRHGAAQVGEVQGVELLNVVALGACHGHHHVDALYSRTR